MTRDDFIPMLESYLDEYEGATPLPETVREAVRAELPRTKQVRSFSGLARNMTMFSNRTAQIALGLAAAGLIITVGAFLYSGQKVGGPDDTPPPSTRPSTDGTASPSAQAACESTQASMGGLGGRMIQIDWCAYGPGEPGAVAFTMEGPSEWLDFWVPGASTLWIRPSGGGAITLALTQDASVDEVLTEISGRSGYSVANEQPISVDGMPGVVLDVSLAEGAASEDAEPLIADDDQTWRLQEGTFSRVWIVERNGDALIFATGEDLADALGDALGTLAWQD